MGERGPQYQMKFRVDGKRRQHMSGTWVSVEVQTCLDNIAQLYARSRSECVEQALRLWLKQFPAEEKFCGLKHVRSQAKKYVALCKSQEDEQDISEELRTAQKSSLTIKDVEIILKERGFPWLMTAKEVMKATGYNEDEVRAFVTEARLDGKTCYRRLEVARHVDPEMLLANN